MKSLTKPTNTPESLIEFIAIADKIVQFASVAGVQIIGYRSDELPHFRALSVIEQEKVLKHLKVFVRTLEFESDSQTPDQAEGEALVKHERSLWYAMSALDFVPPSELFSKMTSQMVIEIYDLHAIQIWRNFNCMKVCSYTLEEMFSLEWFKRYDRPEEISQECFLKLNALIEGSTPDVYFANIPRHTITETHSASRLKLSAHHQWFARLKNRAGVLNGYIILSNAEVLDDISESVKSSRRLKMVPLVEELL